MVIWQPYYEQIGTVQYWKQFGINIPLQELVIKLLTAWLRTIKKKPIWCIYSGQTFLEKYLRSLINYQNISQLKFHLTGYYFSYTFHIFSALPSCLLFSKYNTGSSGTERRYWETLCYVCHFTPHPFPRVHKNSGACMFTSS